MKKVNLTKEKYMEFKIKMFIKLKSGVFLEHYNNLLLKYLQYEKRYDF